MELRLYLSDTFKYNDYANCRLIAKVKELPDPAPCVKLISHLANCQYKWMARITQDPKVAEMSWWDPVYFLDELEYHWKLSLQPWLDYLQQHTDEYISEEVSFIGFDGGLWAATPKDIAIQLNNHSIHHRAQMQTIIRQQGLEPDFLDYIGTVYRKLSS